jgi:hypothetical protein
VESIVGMAKSAQEQAFDEIHDGAVRILEFVPESNSELYDGLSKLISLARYQGLWVEHPSNLAGTEE